MPPGTIPGNIYASYCFCGLPNQQWLLADGRLRSVLSSGEPHGLCATRCMAGEEDACGGADNLYLAPWWVGGRAGKVL